MTKWTLPVIKGELGDYFIELSDEILESSGFEVGDTIVWTKNDNGSYTITKKENKDTDIYIVETISSHHLKYAIRAKSAEDAMDYVYRMSNSGDIVELHQKHHGEFVKDATKISKKEYLKCFDELNDYLKSWSKEQKLDMINEVDYEDNK
jgi:hypothetical protein